MSGGKRNQERLALRAAIRRGDAKQPKNRAARRVLAKSITRRDPNSKVKAKGEEVREARKIFSLRVKELQSVDEDQIEDSE